MKQKDNRGGRRPNAGRKLKNGAKREYNVVRILREAYESIPQGVNKCDYVSALIIKSSSQDITQRPD